MKHFEDNSLLFGHDPLTGIVAVEPVGHHIRLFRRESGRLTFHDEEFHPFILCDDPSIVSGCGAPAGIRKLKGPHRFSCQLLFDTWHDCVAARDALTRHYPPRTPGHSRFHFVPDICHQYLLSTGKTMFKGMDFSDLKVVALDIETYCVPEYGFSNPERDADRIISIAIADSCGHDEVIRGDRMSEPDMLTALSERIRVLDPDVITGHNIFRFDLNYIVRRGEKCGVHPGWGRNGSAVRMSGHSRLTVAERTVEFPRWDIYGRHVVDTYFLAELYDISARELEHHGLKHVARVFGVESPQRLVLTGSEISGAFGQNPEYLYRYNLQDAQETLAVFRILAYPWFLQTRIFPYSFQNCPLRGNATRINSLFLREYLFRGHSIPAPPQTPVPFEGGYTAIFRQGVAGPVAHCDVTSLYPSLILAYRIHPVNDDLGIFIPLMETLRSFRVTAKHLAAERAGAESCYYDSLQQVFKILINSFFGYLGSPRHNFSDPEAAAEITRLGRLTLREMLAALTEAGAEPVEADTDGIYFIPPHADLSIAGQLVRNISASLPEGIDVELDGTYKTMFAYKAKNYALLCHDGNIAVRGSSLKSRGMEPYLKEFIGGAVTRLLEGRPETVEDIYGEIVRKLRDRRFEAGWIAHTETLNESVQSYLEKVRLGRRNPSAAFETAIASGLTYRPGDQVSYYVSGGRADVHIYENCKPVSAFRQGAPDVNIPYYIRRLSQVKKRFEQFIPKQPGLFDD